MNNQTHVEPGIEELERLTDPEQQTEQAATATSRKNDNKPKDTEKPKKYTMPFVACIFSRPDRVIEPIIKKTRKGTPTGVETRLVAEISLPLVGHVLTVKGSIWENTRYSREDGGFIREYDLSVGDRFNLTVSDEARPAMAKWKAEIIGPGGQFEKWLASDAAKAPTNRLDMTPRLRKVVAVDQNDPQVLEFLKRQAAAKA